MTQSWVQFMDCFILLYVIWNIIHKAKVEMLLIEPNFINTCSHYIELFRWPQGSGFFQQSLHIHLLKRQRQLIQKVFLHTNNDKRSHWWNTDHVLELLLTQKVIHKDWQCHRIHTSKFHWFLKNLGEKIYKNQMMNMWFSHSLLLPDLP